MKGHQIMRANTVPINQVTLSLDRPPSSRHRKVNQNTEQIANVETEFIENLQQQVYLLESEVSYLRTNLDESTRANPKMAIEAEKMVKKLLESQKEVQNLKIELKRKATALDILSSEKEKFLHEIDENEVTHKTEKAACLDEMVGLRKERDVLEEKVFELEKSLKDSSEIIDNLQDDIGKLNSEVKNLKQELSHTNEVIQKYKQTVESQQKEYFSEQMKCETAVACDKQASLKQLKTEIQQMHERLQLAEQTTAHERLLRTRIAEDNALFIKRYADLEAELAEVRSSLREEQGIRSSLEALHSKLAEEVAETRSHDIQLKTDLQGLLDTLKQEKERSLQLSHQLGEEQRQRSKECRKMNELDRKLDKKEEKLKIREKENTELQRDNIILKDKISALKKQVAERDTQMENMKQKVQEMQVSVEEYMHSSHAASKIQGHRFRQLLQLAEGIHTLSQKAADENELP